MSLAWWNGRLLPLEEVRIGPEDMLGDGLFETLRVDGGIVWNREAHLDRLFAGLPRVGIEPPEDRDGLQQGMLNVAAESPWRCARLRIIVTPSMRLISVAPYTRPEGPVSAVLLREPWIWSRSPLVGLKTLSCQANRMALRRALLRDGNAYEVLLLNERGRLVEGSRSNVIVILDDGAFTPPLEDGCLPGTVRQLLLESGKIAERALAPADLREAKAVLLTNSLIDALVVERIR